MAFCSSISVSASHCCWVGPGTWKQTSCVVETKSSYRPWKKKSFIWLKRDQKKLLPLSAKRPESDQEMIFWLPKWRRSDFSGLRKSLFGHFWVSFQKEGKSLFSLWVRYRWIKLEYKLNTHGILNCNPLIHYQKLNLQNICFCNPAFLLMIILCNYLKAGWEEWPRGEAWVVRGQVARFQNQIITFPKLIPENYILVTAL